MARILLVEDDPDVRPLLEHILLRNDFQVTTIESVAGAISLLSSQPYDLVVTDVNLPDGSGLRVADRAAATGVKALVITGQGLSLAPGSLAGYDYLLKPLRVDVLLAAIARCLASAEAAQVVRFPKAE
ncbi:MAG TPA: response regulator [Stellaceae bacterium]|jgi:DNA-binding NtrC family response regulator|nr:response regulator [Stellaceae bacterium]